MHGTATASPGDDDDQPVPLIVIDRMVDHGRQCLVADDIIVQVTDAGRRRRRVVITIGGEAAQRLQADRQRRQRLQKRRERDDLLDLGDIGYGGEDGL